MERVTLTPRELVLPEARTLDSDVLEAYQEAIKSYSEKARKCLSIFSDSEGELAGSNCLAPLALRNFLPAGARLSTMADLGRATEINPEFLRGFYSDTGLVLRTAGDSHAPNDFLAKDLAAQLKERGIDLRNPKIIYFDALDLRQDTNSYGLAFDLNERAKPEENIIDAPELVSDFRFRTINEKGIPVRDDKGNRTLYARKDGLSRFFLGGGSCVDSNNRYLASSSDLGRVVVVSAEGTTPEK